MDYKKIIKNRNMRLAILKCLCFIPDKAMLKLQYRIKTGRKLDLKNPQRYTEKLQWYKLNYKNPLMIPCVDKYDVRSYVESKGLGHILNECYGVFDRVEDIDFDALPSRFVLKDTLGSGGNSVILVKDKNTMDLEAVKKQLQKWVNENHRIRSGGREWPYYTGKKHRIIAEKYLMQMDEDLLDYKFFCFDGKVELCYIIGERKVTPHGKIAIVDNEYNLLEAISWPQEPCQKLPSMPSNYAEMKEIASILAKSFPHVRVDLYSIEGEIRFGELTFYGASGYQVFQPDDFDYVLGRKFELF